MSCWVYLNVAHRLAKVKFVQYVGCMDLDLDFCFSFTDKCPWDPEEALDAEVSCSEESKRSSEGASRAGSTLDPPEPGNCSDNAEVSRGAEFPGSQSDATILPMPLQGVLTLHRRCYPDFFPGVAGQQRLGESHSHRSCPRRAGVIIEGVLGGESAQTPNSRLTPCARPSWPRSPRGDISEVSDLCS